MKAKHVLTAFVAVTLFIVANVSQATELGTDPGGTSVTQGLKGSKDGVFVCHCPDDKLECYCDVAGS